MSFVAPIVPASLDGLGGYGGCAHTGDEWLSLKTTRQATHRAAILICRLTRETGARLVENGGNGVFKESDFSRITIQVCVGPLDLEGGAEVSNVHGLFNSQPECEELPFLE